MDHDDILREIGRLPVDNQREILDLLEELQTSRTKLRARESFLPFVKTMWRDFVEGSHHRVIAEVFDDVVEGNLKRVIINMAPRHTKSLFASVYLPSYFLGRYPTKKVIQSSHTAELAVDFGRKVRGIINSGEFHDLFPGVMLAAESKAAGRWATSMGGEYFAIGTEGAVTGKGADLLIIDDPHSEQDAVIAESNPEVYDKVMSWYEGGPRQRLQPGGAIIIVMTRWSLRDLTGQLVKKQIADSAADQWEIIELPAILPSGTPIWPEYWSVEELLRTKASIPLHKWNAQYQQQPTAEEGALIKREHWVDWDKPKPPKCTAIIQSWDTAFTKTTRADYSACTTWGIFVDEEAPDDRMNRVILLDAIKGKWTFPELKKKAKQHYDEWEPNICLIEARAAGHPLIFEMRQMNIPVQDVGVGRGTVANPNDKISRVNSITDIFASKMVYAPKLKSWAQEVIEECAAFPAGEHDDFVDTVAMALQRFRLGGWIGTANDDDEDKDKRARRPISYY